MPKARAHKHPNKYVWSIPQALYICSDVCEILTVSIQDTSQDGQKPVYSKENPTWDNPTWDNIPKYRPGEQCQLHSISADASMAALRQAVSFAP